MAEPLEALLSSSLLLLLLGCGPPPPPLDTIDFGPASVPVPAPLEAGTFRTFVPRNRGLAREGLGVEAVRSRPTTGRGNRRTRPAGKRRGGTDLLGGGTGGSKGRQPQVSLSRRCIRSHKVVGSHKVVVSRSRRSYSSAR